MKEMGRSRSKEIRRVIRKSGQFERHGNEDRADQNKPGELSGREDSLKDMVTKTEKIKTNQASY